MPECPVKRQPDSFGSISMAPELLQNTIADGLTTYFAKASGVETKLWVRIVFALAVTAVIWAMYVPLFGLELPVGELFE